jgi:hypothetical protein
VGELDSGDFGFESFTCELRPGVSLICCEFSGKFESCDPADDGVVVDTSIFGCEIQHTGGKIILLRDVPLPSEITSLSVMISVDGVSGTSSMEGDGDVDLIGGKTLGF